MAVSKNVKKVHTPPARFRMQDKATGEHIGILTLLQGQVVPDLSRVECCKIDDGPESFDQDKAPKNSEDINGNNLCQSTTEKMVDNFVEQLDRNYQLKSGVKASALKAIIENLVRQGTTTSYDDDTTHQGTLKIQNKCPQSLTKGQPNFVKAEDFMKPLKLGWLRRVALRYTQGGTLKAGGYIMDVWYVTPPETTDGSRQELRGREEIENYLKETRDTTLTVNDFCMGKVVLGLPSGYESTIMLKKGSDSYDDFKKPFSQGWLRTVMIRSSDHKVTTVNYYTPPDSEGRRVRLRYKRDIADYLVRTAAKNLDVGDFVIARKVTRFFLYKKPLQLILP